MLTDCVSQGGREVRTPHHKIAWELMGTTWKISPLVSEDVTTPDSLAMPGLGPNPEEKRLGTFFHYFYGNFKPVSHN